MTKHPAFRRSKVIVSKGNYSAEKDNSHMASTKMTNSESTYKNESLQFKNTKNEFFEADLSMEKSKNLEIDFNFGDDLRLFGNKNALITNLISPSFPGQISTQNPGPDHVLITPNQEQKKDEVEFDKKGNFVLNSESFREMPSLPEDLNISKIEGDGESPKADVRHSIKPMFFMADNKLHKFGEHNGLDQSFNENPMNSINNIAGYSEREAMKNPFAEKELSFKHSSDLST